MRKDPRYERYRYQVFAVTWLAYMTFYLTRASFAIAKVGFEDDPDVSATAAQLGTVDLVYWRRRFSWRVRSACSPRATLPTKLSARGAFLIALCRFSSSR